MIQVVCRLKLLIAQWEIDNNEDRLTYKKLSEHLETGERTVRRWAHNKVGSYDGRVLAAVCKFFDCEISDVLSLRRDDD